MELFLITWVTHKSRISERMEKYLQTKNKGLQPLVLNDADEVEVTRQICNITQQDNLKIIAYNICKNHVHLILACETDDRDNIVRKLKGKSTQLFKVNKNINTKFHLWAQKYNWLCITGDDQFSNLYEYVTQNRVKHGLEENRELELIIDEMLTPYDKLFNES